VEIGQAIGQTGTAVKERNRRPFRHPAVAVGRAGRDALKQTEHAAHARHAVERGDEMHFAGARVGKARVDADASSVRTKVSAPFTLGFLVSASYSRLAVGSHGNCGAALRLEGFDHIAVLERTSMSSMPRIRRSLRSGLISNVWDVPSRRGHLLVRQVDGDRGARLLFQLPPENVDGGFRQRHGDDGLFWMQLTWKISPKLGPISACKPKSITAKAAPSRDEPQPKSESVTRIFRVTIGRQVQHEVGARLRLLVEAQVVEEGLAVVVAGRDAAHVAAGQDHAGVDLGNLQGRGNGGENGEGLHQRPQDISRKDMPRTSASRPCTAAAATIAGLMIWVSAPRPWRPSKFRLVVEAQRSPGATSSPFDPLHIEQPESRHSSPASMKDAVQPFQFSLPLHGAGARRHHARHADAPAFQHIRRRAQIFDARVGARTDEDAIDGRPVANGVAGLSFM